MLRHNIIMVILETVIDYSVKNQKKYYYQAAVEAKLLLLLKESVSKLNLLLLKEATMRRCL